MDEKKGHCPLCGWYGRLTEHHSLWPRRRYVNHPKHHVLTTLICRACHDLIHGHYDRTRYGDQTTDEVWTL